MPNIAMKKKRSTIVSIIQKLHSCASLFALLSLTISGFRPVRGRHVMPLPEPPVSAAVVVVAVPPPLQEHDPLLTDVRLPQVEPAQNRGDPVSG